LTDKKRGLNEKKEEGKNGVSWRQGAAKQKRQISFWKESDWPRGSRGKRKRPDRETVPKNESAERGRRKKEGLLIFRYFRGGGTPTANCNHGPGQGGDIERKKKKNALFLTGQA